MDLEHQGEVRSGEANDFERYETVYIDLNDIRQPVYDLPVDPLHIVSYPSFKIVPTVTIPEESSSNVAKFSLVGEVPDVLSVDDRSDGNKLLKKRLKRSCREYIPTSLGRISTRGRQLSTSHILSTTDDEDVVVLSCEWDDCDEDFTELKDFMRHVRRHVDNDLPTIMSHEDDRLEEDGFSCLWQECFFASASKSEVIRHIHFHSFHTNLKAEGADIIRKLEISGCKQDPSQRNIVPDLSEPFRCMWDGCKSMNVEFPEAFKFYWHVLWHSEEYKDKRLKELPCLWRGCTSKPKTINKLKEHLRSHSQERVVGCPTCGGLFSNRSKFFDHCKRQASQEERNFKCSFCNKQFALERLLRDHMRQHVNHYKCSQCEMTTPTPSALAAHMAYRHSTEKNFPCSEPGCSYRAKLSNDLLQHVRNIHMGANDFACSITGCFFRCKSRMTLKHHIEKSHNDVTSRYCCHLCEKRFKRGNYLSKHLVAVHKFRWPSGHSRFRYKQDDSGLFHLHTIRFESSELTTHLPVRGVESVENEEEVDDPEAMDDDTKS